MEKEMFVGEEERGYIDMFFVKTSAAALLVRSFPFLYGLETKSRGIKRVTRVLKLSVVCEHDFTFILMLMMCF